MGFLADLWLPILLSSVAVFVASSIIHMVLGYHAGDYKKLPNEEAVRASLGPMSIPPGDYMVPKCDSMKAMKDPEFLKKWTEGPIAIMTVIKPGPPNMTSSLIQWFLYVLVVTIFSAYIASHAVMPGGPYLEVFRFVGCSAFMGYALALLTDSIWHMRNWCTTVKFMFDGLIYALLTAGIFGWLWPSLIELKLNLG